MWVLVLLGFVPNDVNIVDVVVCTFYSPMSFNRVVFGSINPRTLFNDDAYVLINPMLFNRVSLFPHMH